MTAKDVTLDYIRDYCSKDAAKKAWYNAKIAEQVECKVYPRGEGNKADKTQEPKTVLRAIPFVNLRAAFIAEFMPEIAPKAKAASKMYQPL